MNEKLTLTRRTAVALSDCLMLFMGLYGTLFCLITAFHLPVDYRTITAACLVCAPSLRRCSPCRGTGRGRPSTWAAPPRWR